ncbi:MAG: hypothetical protein ACYTA5_20005 [Planctomycetota bacterium]|jgi:hypothetical protein
METDNQAQKTIKIMRIIENAGYIVGWSSFTGCEEEIIYGASARNEAGEMCTVEADTEVEAMAQLARRLGIKVPY